MALIRWQPRESFAIQRGAMDNFDRSSIDDLVSKFWGDVNTYHSTAWHPRVDVVESDHEFTVHAELPGLNKDDIKVTLEDNVLTIEGERKHEDEQKDKHFFRRERSYGTFKRAFKLGTEVQANKIAANYKDGILTLTVPKSEAAKPRQIEVAVS